MAAPDGGQDIALISIRTWSPQVSHWPFDSIQAKYDIWEFGAQRYSQTTSPLIFVVSFAI